MFDFTRFFIPSLRRALLGAPHREELHPLAEACGGWFEDLAGSDGPPTIGFSRHETINSNSFLLLLVRHLLLLAWHLFLVSKWEGALEGEHVQLRLQSNLSKSISSSWKNTILALQSTFRTRETTRGAFEGWALSESR